ncbi:endonuclease/exonuclease/phosphatase family protein [Sphingobacterium sp.]|uniref:endonuclease/exonuclease/phosphatase family protein n=1 Tax=Sphingobacterium sp. TaxID=341027 RepID=UPI0028987CF8|nr:endonuclease/exonuclease/phosphatase family protein [Sphingobacterium sp.]
MLINLPYPRKSRAWNFRLFGLLTLLFCSLSFILSFKPDKNSQQLLTIPTPNLTEAKSGELNVLTYNVAGLPQLISSAKTPRASSIRSIGQRINHFDIVNVQEDFNYNEFLYADNSHPYRTEAMGTIPFSDGLSTLSKYPIVDVDRVAWKDCSGADCFTPKGFSYTRMELSKGVFLDVYNIHATAQDNKDAVKARKQNLIQFANYVKQHSEGEAVLIMGDFNAHYTFSEDNIRDFKRETGMIDGWVEVWNRGEIPGVVTGFKAGVALDIDEACESIDKIYFRGSSKFSFIPRGYRVEKELFQNKDGAALSDHCAISMVFQWKIIEGQTESITSEGSQRDAAS